MRGDNSLIFQKKWPLEGAFAAKSDHINETKGPPFNLPEKEASACSPTQIRTLKSRKAQTDHASFSSLTSVKKSADTDKVFDNC